MLTGGATSYLLADTRSDKDTMSPQDAAQQEASSLGAHLKTRLHWLNTSVRDHSLGVVERCRPSLRAELDFLVFVLSVAFASPLHPF